MSVRRGRPPVLAGGISGSSRAPWASVKSLGNPWPDCRCVSRCSLVHMPNHRLPIVAETVNHANLPDARNFWVRLLEITPGSTTMADRRPAKHEEARMNAATPAYPESERDCRHSRAFMDLASRIYHLTHMAALA